MRLTSLLVCRRPQAEARDSKWTVILSSPQCTLQPVEDPTRPEPVFAMQFLLCRLAGLGSCEFCCCRGDLARGAQDAGPQPGALPAVARGQPRKLLYQIRCVFREQRLVDEPLGCLEVVLLPNSASCPPTETPFLPHLPLPAFPLAGSADVLEKGRPHQCESPQVAAAHTVLVLDVEW